MTTRFPNGVGNVRSDNTLGLMGQPDPTKFHSYVNDFDTYAATDWTVTAVGTGTSALVAGDGGLLAVTTSAAAPDSRATQLAIASFSFTAGKNMFFKIGCQLDNVALSIFQAGLIVTDTTPLDATDGIYFQKAGGTANLDIYVRRDATTGNRQQLNVAQVQTGFNSYGWAYDGKSTVTFFVNDLAVGSIPVDSVNSPDTNLALSFFIGNNSAAARVLTVDYIFAAKER